MRPTMYIRLSSGHTSSTQHRLLRKWSPVTKQTAASRHIQKPFAVFSNAIPGVAAKNSSGMSPYLDNPHCDGNGVPMGYLSLRFLCRLPNRGSGDVTPASLRSYANPAFSQKAINISRDWASYIGA